MKHLKYSELLKALSLSHTFTLVSTVHKKTIVRMSGENANQNEQRFAHLGVPAPVFNGLEY